MEQKQLAIFGAGLKGREAAKYYKAHGHEVMCFIDNAKEKQGTVLDGIPVYGVDDFKRLFDCDISIAGNMLHRKEIEAQLLNAGKKNYCFYDNQLYLDTERIISYCSVQEMEDVILYHLLKGKKDIFYIDVGSNDPTLGSVTKLLYDRLNAHGINIDPLPTFIAQTKRERCRDINLCMGVGKSRGGGQIFVQGGLSTACATNFISTKKNLINIEIETLGNICRQYLKNDTAITFLKIDVEGMEKDVLLGADFSEFRPELILIESTKPNTYIPVFEEWENILIKAGYIFGFMKGVNRFYFAKESYDSYKGRIAELDHLDTYYLVENISSRSFVF